MALQETQAFSIKARDDRFFRAAETVLKRYRITRRTGTDADGMVVFDVRGGTSDYTVKVHPQWRCAPQCSCPDAENRARTQANGYCKHIIAVLLANREFSCQLLEAFL